MCLILRGVRSVCDSLRLLINVCIVYNGGGICTQNVCDRCTECV